jgi:DNA invertase Pin-like site-specific DNA recombinase
MGAAMTKRVALYVRVSTDGQAVANQEEELQAVAKRHGWDVVRVFRDQGISGAKGRALRPGFDALCHGMTRRDFDMVAAWSVDRLGRSLQDLVAFLGELKAKGVGLYLQQQGLDTTTPGGEALFGMLSVFSQFERAMIVDRVRAGLARARREGRVGGRPRVTAEKEKRIKAALASGHGIRKAAQAAGVGTSVVQRIKATMARAGA